MRAAILALAVLLGSAVTAHAAQIPTAEEAAALTALVNGEVGDTCDGWYSRSSPLPLVSDDRTWGTAVVVCEHSSVPSGAGTAVWTVWAHRSSATSTDWAIVRPSAGNRVPPCLGEGGLFTTVPAEVVRELRDSCYDPSSGRGYEPSPLLMLRVFRNVRHEYDDIGPSIGLDSLSHVNGKGIGYFSIAKNGPPLDAGSKPTLKSMRADFGTPRRSGCQARWARISLTATACRGRVTQLTLRAPWRLEPDSERADDLTRTAVEVGDAVPLARYLDPRLAELRADGRLQLPRMRIGTARVTVTVITRGDRITAIEIAIKQV